jgi:guanyl-specific ribonuclease Sa
MDFAAYRNWLESTQGANSSIENEVAENTPHQRNIPATDTHSSTEPMSQASAPVQEPAYPSSFAHIVELITTGQPIPGIQQIPDTILAGYDTPSTKPKRRKPWEKEEAGETHQA